MYKARLQLWGYVLIAFIVFSIISAFFSGVNNGIDSVTIGSDNIMIARFIDNKKLSGGTKMYCSQNNWNIYLSEKEPIDGYKYEEYYSPIVGLCHMNVYSSYIFNDISNSMRTVRVMDLKKILNAFMEDKTYGDVYEKANQNSKLKNTEVKVYADANYEKEIKQVILIAISSEKNPSLEDYEKYKDEVIKIWNKIEKVQNTYDFIKEKEDYILLAPEYENGVNSSCYAVSLTNTVAIKYFLSYKDGYEEIVTNDTFMKRSGLRRSLYEGSYTKGYLSNSDWSVSVVECFDWEITEKEAINETNEITSNEKTDDDLKNENKNTSNKQNEENTNKNESSKASETEKQTDTTSEWDIKTKQGNYEEADKTINPDAYK